jgi:hypothetical protein
LANAQKNSAISRTAVKIKSHYSGQTDVVEVAEEINIGSDYQKFVSKYGYYGLSVLVILIVGLIAVLSLRDGFSGDQALFLIYSKAIDNGAILYKDVWDIKQPAIFVFYLIAGKLFGFNEVGVHLLEIIYWFALCLILITGLRNYFKNPLFAVLTPLFTTGIYYSISGSLHFTQAESLVCFPLFMSLWLCQKFLENPDKKSLLLLSGLFGGIVVTFKLMFIAIIFAFWFCLFVYCCFLFSKKDTKQILASFGFIFLGLLLPITAVIFYFLQNDAFGDLWYTTFVYPYNAVNSVTKMENRNRVLEDGLIWFLKSYFPVVSLTLLLILLKVKSFFVSWRHEENFALRRENFLFVSLFAWVFSGFAVILIQRLSWWEYHYSLLMIPLGILAVKCVEKLLAEIKIDSKLSRKSRAYMLMTVMIALLFVPTTRRLADKIRQSRQTEMIKIGSTQFGVTGNASEDYKSISADVAFLTKENPKPKIFIVSNPLYYYLSDSPPPFASNGAMSDMFTDFEWKRLDREMSEKPPKYIFIETRFIKLIEEASPSFINTLNKNYSIWTVSARGSFYKRNG